jgi:hypothetical protein
MPIPLGVLAVAGAGAAGAGAYDLLETVTPSGTDSVSFTGLGSYSSYRHLQLRMTLRNTSTGTGFDGIQIRLNGDSGSNYAWHDLRGFAGSVASSAQAGDSGMSINYCYAGGSSGSGIFGVVVADILDFNLTTKNKTIRALQGAVVGSNPAVALGSAFRNNTAAITSIEVNGRGRNFATGCRISLYGIK